MTCERRTGLSIGCLASLLEVASLSRRSRRCLALLQVFATHPEYWTHRPYRPTRDLDLSGQGDNSIARIKKVFGDVIAQTVEDDGSVFDPASIQITKIKERTGIRRAASQFLSSSGARPNIAPSRHWLRRCHRASSARD